MRTPEVSHPLHLAVELAQAAPIVLFSGILTVSAMALGTDRRQPALDLSGRIADLAAVLVEANRKTGP